MKFENKPFLKKVTTKQAHNPWNSLQKWKIQIVL